MNQIVFNRHILFFFHIKRAKFDDVVTLLARVTVFDDVAFNFMISTQQQPNSGEEEELEFFILQYFQYLMLTFYRYFLCVIAVFLILVIFVFMIFNNLVVRKLDL